MRAAMLALSALLIAVPAKAQETREPPVIAKKSPAVSRADTLDSLFARLHGVRTEEEAMLAERAIWKLWMSSDSATAEVLLGQAEAAKTAREFDTSLAILDRLVQVHPDFAEAWNKRATLYYMIGRYKESLADIDIVLDLEPRHFGALSGRGMIHRQEKNYSAALAAFREALAIHPNMSSVKDAVKELEKIQQPI